MGLDRKYMVVVLSLCGVALQLSQAQKMHAQTGDAHRDGNSAAIPSTRGKAQAAVRHPAPLTFDDGLSVIAAALDSHVHTRRESDCSHLVHAIYEHAGFSYAYASSSDLYSGTDNFRRVKHPQPGDLVVWTGHVGIVVNPAHRAFFSALSDGPGIDEYDAEYWKQRGAVRFYRYIKGTSRRAAVSPMSSRQHAIAP